MQTKRIFIALLILLTALPAALCFGDVKRYDIPLENSPSLGPSDAPVTIVEFLDYQ